MSRCASAIRMLVIGVTLLPLLICGGCGGGSSSSPASLQIWQKTLEKHTLEDEHGDPSFLRNNDIDNTHRFAILGNFATEKSTDISGALLARHHILGQHRMIFIVGSAKTGQLNDIRLAVMTDGAVTNRWIISEPNSDALATYERAKDSRWSRANPVRTQRPTPQGLFPYEDDRFRAEVAGNTVSVFEDGSGARWTVVITE